MIPGGRRSDDDKRAVFNDLARPQRLIRTQSPGPSVQGSIRASKGRRGSEGEGP